MMMNNKGQALFEYILIVCLISIVIILTIVFFGDYIKDTITKISCSYSEQEYIEGQVAGEGTCKAD